MNNTRSQNKTVIQHIVFLVVAILILTGIYTYFRNPTPVTLAAIGLVLAHLAVFGGVLFIGRKFLSRIFRRMHGMPAQEHTHDDGRTHSHGLETESGLQTEGSTISWAFLYDILVKFLLGGKEKEFRESVIAHANIRPGQKVLDVGCGTGQMAITARLNAPPTVEIYGTDASPEMIARAREHTVKAGLTVDFRTGLVEAIDFPDNSLDIVLSNFIVHHLPEHLEGKAFAEIYRVLKPGGRLQIVEFEPPTNPTRRFFLGLILKDMMHINTRAIPPLLKQAGFTDVTLEGSSHPLATVVTGKK